MSMVFEHPGQGALAEHMTQLNVGRLVAGHHPRLTQLSAQHPAPHTPRLYPCVSDADAAANFE